MICDFWEVLNGSDSLGAVALDFDGNIQRVNEAFSRIVSRDNDELLGRSIVEITEPSHRQSSRAKIISLGNGDRERMCVTKQYIRPNNVPVWCQVEAMVICDPATKQRKCIILFAWQLTEYQKCQEHTDEIETHLKMLQEFVRLTSSHSDNQRININMHGGSEYKQIADRGGRISSKHNDMTMVLVVLAVCLAVVMCVGMVLYAGGYFKLQHNGSQLEVHPAETHPIK